MCDVFKVQVELSLDRRIGEFWPVRFMGFPGVWYVRTPRRSDTGHSNRGRRKFRSFSNCLSSADFFFKGASGTSKQCKNEDNMTDSSPWTKIENRINDILNDRCAMPNSDFSCGQTLCFGKSPLRSAGFSFPKHPKSAQT